MTQDIRYALMFLAKIAQRPWRGPMTVRSVAAAYNLSFKFLEQVVGKLRKARILWVDLGRNGGYGLETKHLSVADVYQALGHQPEDLSCPFPSDCRGGAKCFQKEIEAKLAGKINDEMSKALLC